MPYTVPGTQELIDRNLAGMESSLNQNTPPAEKAFNKVLAVVSAMAERELYRCAEDFARENLALTASKAGLAVIGEEYGIYRERSKAWEGKGIFEIPDGETLYFGTVFISPQGLEYEIVSSVTSPYLEPGSGVLAFLACKGAGPQGNLSLGDTLVIQKPLSVPGAGRTIKITETTALGVEIEDLEVYRQRLLDFERSDGGGGNSSDYRHWAQEVPGVHRAYPFSGPPENTNRDPLPGERTVYIECTEDVEDDGIPPEPLLSLARQALLSDPVTGVSRTVLGLTEETLYVKPIVRTGLHITVTGMTITSGNIGNAEETVEAALKVFIKGFSPFVQGLDAEFDRHDTVTASKIGREVQNILDGYGGAAQSVTFGTLPELPIGKYSLKQNEKLKIIEVIFKEAHSA